MDKSDRRTFMTGIGGAALAAFTSSSVLAKPRRSYFEKMKQPVGLQFGNFGIDPRTDIDAAFAQVAEIGFGEVELSNLFGKQPAEIAAAATRAGVKIASLHLPLQAMGGLSMGTEPARIGEVMGALGAKWAVAPITLFPGAFRPKPGESMETAVSRTMISAGEDIWKKTAEALNTHADKLQPLGIGVAYHNHNFDFAPIGKTTGFDILRRETDPRLLHFEVDVGWIDLAGIDPVRVLDKLRGRVRLIHVRDIVRDKPQSFEISMTSPVVGSGRLDWARILPAAHRAGARHFIVEQEPPSSVTAADALKQAFAFLSQVKAK